MSTRPWPRSRPTRSGTSAPPRRTGSAHELVINHGRPWGFPLEDIEIGVHLWQGEEDPSVPPAMGRYIAQTIPSCEATFIAGAGHLWIVDHVGDVLDALVPDG